MLLFASSTACTRIRCSFLLGYSSRTKISSTDGTIIIWFEREGVHQKISVDVSKSYCAEIANRIKSYNLTITQIND